MPYFGPNWDRLGRVGSIRRSGIIQLGWLKRCSIQNRKQQKKHATRDHEPVFQSILDLPPPLPAQINIAGSSCPAVMSSGLITSWLSIRLSSIGRIIGFIVSGSSFLFQYFSHFQYLKQVMSSSLSSARATTTCVVCLQTRYSLRPMAPQREQEQNRGREWECVHQSVELDEPSSTSIREISIVKRILKKMRLIPDALYKRARDGIIDFIIDLNQCLPR